MDLAVFTPLAIVVVCLGFFLGGFAKGTTGIGLPLIAVPIAAVVVQPKVAIALMAGPIIISNIWMVVTSRQTPAMARRFWPLLVLCVPTCAAASLMLVAVPVQALMVWLGLTVLAIVSLQIFPIKLVIPPRHEKAAAAVTGIIAGTLQGLSGFSGPAFSVFLLAIKADKDTFAVAISLFFLIVGLPLFFVLSTEGILGGTEWIVSVLLALPVLAGVWCGQIMRRYLSATLFRRALLAMLIVIGLQLFLEGLGLF